MSIKGLIEKIVLDKKNQFTIQDIINDKRIKQYPHRRHIIQTVVYDLVSDKTLSEIYPDKYEVAG